MRQDPGYKKHVERRLRQVVADVLEEVAVRGLARGQAIYITFITTGRDVAIPSWLLEKYPENMTIVFEHQFWDLQVDGEGFFVTLLFDERSVRLYVPFGAVTRIADPGHAFTLAFEARRESHSGDDGDILDLEDIRAKRRK